MQLEWLRAFVLLKETESFTEAAEEMFVSQSSFSKYIKALEGELGTKLIDRSHHRLALTREGEAVYPHILRMLADYDQVLGSLKTFREQQRQLLRVCVATGTSAAPYIRRILDFFREHPTLALQMHEYDSDTARRALQSRELDLAIGYFGPDAPISPDGAMDEEFYRRTLREERLLYVGSRKAESEVGKDKAGKGGIGESGIRKREVRKYEIEESETEILEMRNHGMGESEALRCEENGTPTLAQITSDRLILHQNMYREITGLLMGMGIPLPTRHPIVTTTSMDVLKAYLQGGSARSLMTETALEILDPGHELTGIAPLEQPVLTLELVCGKGLLNQEAGALVQAIQGSGE